jgi:hypothetical protein
MPSAKGEAGDLGSKPAFEGAAAKGEAGSLSAAVGVGASTAAAGGAASGSSVAQAQGGSIVLTQSEVQLKIGRTPFSEPGMVERFIADPTFYRNLAAYVASEIRRQAETVDNKGNLGASTKSQLTELADGFSEIAMGLTTQNGLLTPQAAAVAASLVTKLRETYAAIMKSHPELIQLASIGLAAYAFHHFGDFDPNLSLLVSAAVVKKEKLVDVISAWLSKKK